MSEMTEKDLLAARNRRYRRLQTLRCKNANDIRAFVDDMGVCLLFPVQGVEMPNVYQAVAGFDKETTPKHDDPTISLTWGTKDESLGKRWWYYGKLLRGKATLVSLELFSAFYALSENFGSEDDYLLEYEAGTLSNDAKRIYEALLKEGKLHAIQLKRASGMYGDENKAKFDRALTELQTGLKVMPVGVAQAGAWHYAFIYEIVSRHLPEECVKAQAYTRAQAREAILARHMKNVIQATPQELKKVFGKMMS